VRHECKYRTPHAQKSGGRKRWPSECKSTGRHANNTGSELVDFGITRSFLDRYRSNRVFVPVVTLFALTVLFSAYAKFDGIVSLTAAARPAKHGEHWWELILVGIAGIGTAIFTVIWPGLTLPVLIYIITAWSIVSPGAVVLAWWIGAYIVFLGIPMLALALRLRRWSGALHIQQTV
jgi:hypothetical protein